MKYVDLLKSQYESFPYPTNTSSNGGYRELVNLAKLLRLDCGYHLQRKRILDAGTGTGLRLLELAAAFRPYVYWAAWGVAPEALQRFSDLRVGRDGRLNDAGCGSERWRTGSARPAP